MRERRNDGVKGLEHFTEKTEEAGGHGEVVAVEAAKLEGGWVILPAWEEHRQNVPILLAHSPIEIGVGRRVVPSGAAT